MIDFSWLTLFSIAVTSILLHELGHWVLLSFYTKKNNIAISLCNKNGWALRVGENDDYLGLSRIQRNRVYLLGFITQALWIILCSVFINFNYIFILIFAVLVSQNDFNLVKGGN